MAIASFAAPGFLVFGLCWRAIVSGREITTKSGVSRRRLLQTTAAGAGAAIGSGAIGGFPTIWAQNIKDVTLVHIGGSYAGIKEIAEQARRISASRSRCRRSIPQLSSTARSPSRRASISTTSTILDRLTSGEGRAEADSRRQGYKLWDKTVPIFTTGKFPDGRPIPTQGLSPIKTGFWTGPDAKKLADKPTDFLTMVPSLFNADTLGIRPDLVGGRDKVTSWGDLLDPKYKGKAALVDYAPVGIIDVAMALEARGDIKYGDKGNMTKAEIDKTIKIVQDSRRPAISARSGATSTSR